MSYTYDYPHPAVTVDCVVFAVDNNDLKVMLIERGEEPFKNQWALPGGFVKIDEALDEAARRELEEETGLKGIFLEQLYTYGGVQRDPRERVISVAYMALVNLEGHDVKASTDAVNAAWFSLDDLPDLAFDHEGIIEQAQERLEGKVRYQPIGFELLPELFTLTELQTLYEIILGRELDKRNFRKKIQKMNFLTDTGELQKDVSHRAAKLYSFNKERYDELVKAGFNFEL